jgi:hypothetical protein
MESINIIKSRAIAQAVSHRLLTAGTQVRSRAVHVGSVVDKVALGQVFVRVRRFPCRFIPPVRHFHSRIIRGMVNELIGVQSFTVCPIVKQKQTTNMPSFAPVGVHWFLLVIMLCYV